MGSQAKWPPHAYEHAHEGETYVVIHIISSKVSLTAFLRMLAFICTYPGCERAFSVVSNAKRHMRTHGVGIVTDDVESAPAPYVVGFEAPVVVPVPPVEPDSPNHKSPVRLRWIYPGGDGRWIAPENDASIPDMDAMPQASTSRFNSG